MPRRIPPSNSGWESSGMIRTLAGLLTIAFTTAIDPEAAEWEQLFEAMADTARFG